MAGYLWETLRTSRCSPAIFSSLSRVVGVTPPCCLPIAPGTVPDPFTLPSSSLSTPSFTCPLAQALPTVYMSECSQRLRRRKGLGELRGLTSHRTPSNLGTNSVGSIDRPIRPVCLKNELVEDRGGSLNKASCSFYRKAASGWL